MRALLSFPYHTMQKNMKAAVFSAAVITGAALVIPVLAQTDVGDTTGIDPEQMADEASSPGSASSSSAIPVRTYEGETGTATDEEGGSGTGGDEAAGGTIPSELPDTGGGWRAHR